MEIITLTPCFRVSGQTCPGLTGSEAPDVRAALVDAGRMLLSGEDVFTLRLACACSLAERDDLGLIRVAWSDLRLWPCTSCRRDVRRRYAGLPIAHTVRVGEDRPHPSLTAVPLAAEWSVHEVWPLYRAAMHGQTPSSIVVGIVWHVLHACVEHSEDPAERLVRLVRDCDGQSVLVARVIGGQIVWEGILGRDDYVAEAVLEYVKGDRR